MLTLGIIPHTWAISVPTEDGNALLCCCFSGGATGTTQINSVTRIWLGSKAFCTVSAACSAGIPCKTSCWTPGGSNPSRGSEAGLTWGLAELMEQLSCRAAPRSHLWPLPLGFCSQAVGMDHVRAALCSPSGVGVLLPASMSLPAARCFQVAARQWKILSGWTSLQVAISACFSLIEVII